MQHTKQPLKNQELENIEHTKSLNRISNVIRNAGQFSFETFVLENLNEESDRVMFKEIWKKATEFGNWNYADIEIGAKKTKEILQSYYKLENDVLEIIVSRAGYDWI